MVKSHIHGFSGTTGQEFRYGDGWEDRSARLTGRSIVMLVADKDDYSGIVYAQRTGNSDGNSGSRRGTQGYFSIDARHKHDFSGTTVSNDNSATETRPMNYTIRVWKRTA